MNEWTNVRTNGRMNERTNERTNEPRDVKLMIVHSNSVSQTKQRTKSKSVPTRAQLHRDLRLSTCWICSPESEKCADVCCHHHPHHHHATVSLSVPHSSRSQRFIKNASVLHVGTSTRAIKLHAWQLAVDHMTHHDRARTKQSDIVHKFTGPGWVLRTMPCDGTDTLNGSNHSRNVEPTFSRVASFPRSELPTGTRWPQARFHFRNCDVTLKLNMEED